MMLFKPKLSLLWSGSGLLGRCSLMDGLARVIIGHSEADPYDPCDHSLTDIKLKAKLECLVVITRDFCRRDCQCTSV